jgi:hypothetical protein
MEPVVCLDAAEQQVLPATGVKQESFDSADLHGNSSVVTA